MADDVAPPRAVVPKRNPPEADNIMTPPHLAERIVKYFKPVGSVLEPCAGDGAFLDALIGNTACVIQVCENREGAACWNSLDFFQWQSRHNWVITNPPYSIFTPFLKHCFEVSNNVVFLCQGTRPFFAAPLNAARDAGFGLKEFVRVPLPEEWRKAGLSFGMGLAAVHWQRGYVGPMTITDWTVKDGDK